MLKMGIYLSTITERNWVESEFAAPGYSINGFLSALQIARARRDVVGADRWKDIVRRIAARPPDRRQIGCGIGLARGQRIGPDQRPEIV